MSQARVLPREAVPPRKPLGHGVATEAGAEPVGEAELDALLAPVTYTVRRGASVLWPWGDTTP